MVLVAKSRMMSLVAMCMGTVAYPPEPVGSGAGGSGHPALDFRMQGQVALQRGRILAVFVGCRDADKVLFRLLLVHTRTMPSV